MARLFQPLVSIVIPVYNGSNYLREAIESALTQSYRKIEVLVINDGSRDNNETRRIALSFGKKIRYHEKENGGVSTALNCGIGMMKGDYLSWLSHDDVYFPYKLKEQVNMLQATKKNVILYGDYDVIDENSSYVRTESVLSNADLNMRYSLMVSHPVHGCTTLVPRECFDKVGLFNETLKAAQDYEMWFRLASEYRFVHMGVKLIKSRIHKDQNTNLLNSIGSTEENNLYIYMVRTISESEITNNYTRSLTRAYIDVLHAYRKKRCLEASRVVMQMAIKSIDYRKIGDAVVVIRTFMTIWFMEAMDSLKTMLIPLYKNNPRIARVYRWVKYSVAKKVYSVAA